MQQSHQHPRPSEVAFVIPAADGSLTSVRIDFDQYVSRLASLAERLIQITAARRGRVPQPIPDLEEAVDCLLFQAAVECAVGDNGDDGDMVWG